MKRSYKLLSLVLSVCLIVSILPFGAIAADAEPQHLAECGAVCAHTEHYTDCGFVAATEGSPCTHTCADGACAYTAETTCPNEGCTGEEEGHVATVPGTLCDHSHSADCGYAAATEGTACSHDHAVDEWVCAEGCPLLTGTEEVEPEKELTTERKLVYIYDYSNSSYIYNSYLDLTYDSEVSNSIQTAAETHPDILAELAKLQATNSRYYISGSLNGGSYVQVYFKVKPVPTMTATVSSGTIAYQTPSMSEPAPYTQAVGLDGSATFYFTPDAGFELSTATLNYKACTLTEENGVYSYTALEQDLPYGGTLAVSFIEKPEISEDLTWDLSAGDIAVSPRSDSEYLVVQSGVRRTMPSSGTMTLTGTATSMASNGYNSPSKTAVQIADGLHLNLATTDLNLTMNYSRANAITLGKDTVVNWTVAGDTSLNASYANCVKLGENAALTITGSGKLTAVNDGVDCAAINVPESAKLNIDGATVSATGGGAGIGSNWSNNALTAGEINIVGGAHVTAQGGNSSAGIGGGQYGNGGTVYIAGAGTVVIASGGGEAAGIGGGGQSSALGYPCGAGTLIVSDGASVTATGRGGAAGIGRGRLATAALQDGYLQIESGCTVTAYADGTRFAIDANEAGNGSAGKAHVLNGRFAEDVLPTTAAANSSNPIVVYNPETGWEATLQIPAGTISYSVFRSFATTVPAAGTYMVRSGAEGKTLEHADYALLGQDARFLFTVDELMTPMTTRDELTLHTFKITATAGDNGTISDAGETVVAPLGGKTYTFTSNTGYAVDAVRVNGEAVTVTGGSYTFENLTADASIEVTFKSVPGPGPGPGPSPRPDPTPNPQPTPDDDVIIEDEDTPLSDLPVEDATEAPADDLIIADPEVPLGDLPHTGAVADLPTKVSPLAPLLALIAAMLCAGAAIILGKRKKNEEV